ncbi:hypothetical protein Dimus_020755, partial [Dionaea muscipula]
VQLLLLHIVVISGLLMETWQNRRAVIIFQTWKAECGSRETSSIALITFNVEEWRTDCDVDVNSMKQLTWRIRRALVEDVAAAVYGEDVDHLLMKNKSSYIYKAYVEYLRECMGQRLHVVNSCRADVQLQRWENLFKKRLLVHVDAVKEFYAKMTVIHLKKKDVVKSSVKGISIEFDHEQCVAILDVHWKKLECVNTSRRCGKSQGTQNHLTLQEGLQMMKPSQLPEELSLDHELPYGDWLTLVFEAFGVPLVVKKGEEPKIYDYFEETFLTMCKLTRENGIWWIGSGENRRRDHDVNAPKEEAEEEKERNKDDFDWEAVIDEATIEGESGSDDQFYDAQVEVEEPVTETPATQRVQTSSPAKQKEQGTAGVDPSCPTGRLPEAEFLKFQAEFERKRANRFHDDLEKAKARMPDFSLTPPSPNQTPSLDFLT